MTRPKTILCDVDGVIADFYRPMLKALEHNAKIAWKDTELEKTLKYEDITTYWCSKEMPKEHAEFTNSIVTRKEFWDTLPVVTNALKGANELRKQGHIVLFVTCPTITCPEWYYSRLSWLRKCFSWVDRSNLIVTEGKEFIDGDIMIDDSEDNLDKWRNRRRQRNGRRKHTAMLFEAPYNSLENRRDKSLETVNWSTVPKLISKLR